MRDRGRSHFHVEGEDWLSSVKFKAEWGRKGVSKQISETCDIVLLWSL